MAEGGLAEHAPEASDGVYGCGNLALGGRECWVSRSGYTGEDGYEISVPERRLSDVAQRLLGQCEVEPIGLGARDSAAP